MPETHFTWVRTTLNNDKKQTTTKGVRGTAKVDGVTFLAEIGGPRPDLWIGKLTADGEDRTTTQMQGGQQTLDQAVRLAETRMTAVLEEMRSSAQEEMAGREAINEAIEQLMTGGEDEYRTGRTTRTFAVSITQIDLPDETEYDLHILKVGSKGQERVFPTQDGDSPRCDSLATLQDVMHDTFGDALHPGL